MSYEVLGSELRAAAGDYRGTAAAVGAPVHLPSVSTATLGHVELAAWLEAVTDQCEKATQALVEGAERIADDLDAAAHHYESTDDAAGLMFSSPFGFEPGPATEPGPGW